MKLLTVLIFVLCFWNITFCQKLVKSNKKWEGTKLEYPSENFQAKFRSETKSINGKSYYELTYKVEEGWFEGVQQYYRQQDDKVFKLFNDEEKLIYDFSLNVGDTIQISNDDGDNFKFFPIRTADTTIYNKTLRKLEMRIIPEDNQIISNEKHVWIEGVGDIAFFFGYGEVFNNAKASLIHCVKESTYFYSGPDQQCDGTVSTIPSNESIDEYYTYNRLDKLLTIFSDNITTVQLYSISGEKLRSFDSSEIQNVIDLNNVNQQLCIIVLIGKNVAVSKILTL